MREYIIPQEFNQSDRIGKFTMPQVMILGFSGIIIMAMLSILSWKIAVPISIPLAILTIYVMVKKVNGIPIYEFSLVYLTYRAMPKLYIYRGDNLNDDYVSEELDLFEEELEVK
jgi:hypothetical protein